MTRRWLIPAILFFFLFAPLAWAEEPAQSSGEGPKAAPSAKKEQAPARLEMQEVEIRGELERPEVFYIIPRRKANLDLGSLRKDYSESIMEPLLPGPFEASYGSNAKREAE